MMSTALVNLFDIISWYECCVVDWKCNIYIYMRVGKSLRWDATGNGGGDDEAMIAIHVGQWMIVVVVSK